ncbi:MAG TPA: aldolase/citrate lyase family protein [bacterium]|uniref:4-hydroxy-2-oxovalerate aldolase n=1 Tax=candidate division TA06 bacterium ADurb.Bin417 TaxID=1852828 RepID=A0A1V5MCY4_UNCT6|nr:MAG: 4-hydroxy-2-oxovalerate aldolase [candidate division TA06 bacterium ADurb.Bin417]HNQ34966.1 aldolase/citrate lyase family protein [bacterium]HNS48833.1 aldolase/citrate lyase family protein [bacterium]
MAMVRIKDELARKRVLLGISICYPVPGIIELVGRDWDWIWIDGQHGEHDYNSILGCVRACELVRRPSVVRVPSHDYGFIGLALDTNTSGIMVPMVNNARQAESIVQAAKFPPLGERSYGGRRPVDMHGRAYSHTANEDTLLIAQIETAEGLEQAGEIAAVQGVDAILFGADDLALRASMPMDQPRHPETFRKEMEKVAQAAKETGKIAGVVTPSPDLYRLAVEMGFRLCVGVGEVGILAEGSKNARERLG